MSAQTGVASLPPPPPSVRGAARLRSHVQGLLRDPNPVWIRELRAAARLQRTPVILAVITGMMTLLVCSVGGVAAIDTEPARVGSWLYQTFFSLAFAVVTWMGPSVAASTIAAERSGRTWEALELTGLGPAAIARGKFLASLTYVALYLVMLAPVGALPFLFGGVTALEIVIAFAVLGVLAVLSVAFGLAMSSKMATPSLAILVTLLVAVPASLAAYLGLGVGLAYAVNELWPGVPAGAPVWLPSAYVRADLGSDYLALLVLAPLALVAIPAWLFYEVTIANMARAGDDRSTRLRVWALVSGPLLTAAAVACGAALRELSWFVLGELLLFFLFLFVGFLFAGEPLGPSRRVEVHWERAGRSAARRFLGPGVIPAATLLILLILPCFLTLTAAGTWLLPARDDAVALVAFGGYAAAFLVFIAGFGAFTRSRAASSGLPRVLLLGALFLALVGPWVAMAIAGIIQNGDRALLIAAPSPGYAFHMLSAAGHTGPERDAALVAGAFCAAAWGLIGLGLLSVASVRVRSRLNAEQEQRASLEARAPAGAH